MNQRAAAQSSLNRRQFLQGTLAAAATGSLLTQGCQTAKPEPVWRPEVLTVTGMRTPSMLGVALTHEHVLVDFIGADKVNPNRYSQDEAFEVALPHLQQIKDLGCDTLMECTPAYIGRDPVLLRRLAEATNMSILTNTGYYGAAGQKFIPAHAYTDTVDDLATRWLLEWRHGIGSTGIRPGFIKTGVDAGPLPAINQKLIRACARTHLASGLTIAAHTGDGVAALEELALLRAEGVAGSAFIWVHAQGHPDLDIYTRAAAQGAWVSLDGVGPTSVTRHVEWVVEMKQRGLLRRVLVSHDAGWYNVGEPKGGNYRPYDVVFTKFIPALRDAGFTDDDVRQLMVSNPAEAFTMRVRRL